MSDITFDWIPAYEAIATKLLDYENRQDELCALVEEILDEHYEQMDPLTFFSMFNGKRASFDRRSEAVRIIIDRFGLDVDAPAAFHGIPVTNPQRWRFWGGGSDVINHNWEVFRAALAYADNPTPETRIEFVRLFDIARAQRNIGDANLTMAFYWIRPHVYIPADKNTRNYLRNRYDIRVQLPLNGDGYLMLLDEVKEKVDRGLPKVSYAAWELGGWVPAPSEYDPGITADMWEHLLRDKDFITPNALITLHCLARHPEGVTCSELDDDYGRGPHFYNNNVSTLGESVCNRLGVEPREQDGAGKYWPVLCTGSCVGKSRHGVFEWRLRPELLEAVKRLGESSVPLEDEDVRGRYSFDRDKLARLVKLYKKDFSLFRVPGSEEGDQEVYKWRDALAYRDNWDIDAVGEAFAAHLRDAFRPSSVGQGALLGNGYSYPFQRLSKLVEYDAEGVREAFRVLYAPENSLRDAYTSFVEMIDAILQEHDESAVKALEDSHQSPSAVSLYLTFEMPERYHFFKPSVCEDFARCIGTKLPSNPVAKMVAYESLADAVLPELLADDELVAMCDNALSEDLRAVDPARHWMLQDVVYYSSRYMKHWHPDWEKLISGDKEKKMYGEDGFEGATYPSNIILYGPPGTGKTYCTRAYAVAICKGLPVEDVVKAMSDPDEYEKVSKDYDELVKQGRVGFTTFHQSYGYEEFIEGLRPEYDEDKGVVTYPLRKGVFREFCEAAEDMVAVALAEEGIPSFPGNPRPRVWKMGLKTRGFPDLLEHCREEGSLRMGWDHIAPDEVDDERHGLSDQNRRAIYAFQEEMQPGDFVVIPGASGVRYDVAVITGDFEWDESMPGVRRKRSAQWFDGIDKADFLPLNGGKALTLQTAYELSRVSPSKLLEAMDINAVVDDSAREAKPYVFIIDEINRGNVSKVFGELITILEPIKRKGAKEEMLVRLPYSGDWFGVPSNVHVLGTMNTADRSIALMDTALRRRFEFIEVMPDSDLLNGVSVEGVDVAEMLKVMNQRIELLYDREHTLGHAYLFDLKDEPSLERLAQIFETRFIPLLQEYFFDDYKKIRSVLGEAADDFIHEDKEASSVFCGEDASNYADLKVYRVGKAPRDADAYKRIYQLGNKS